MVIYSFIIYPVIILNNRHEIGFIGVVGLKIADR
jgi:hypothetical protein